MMADGHETHDEDATTPDLSGWKLHPNPSRKDINNAEAENIQVAAEKYLLKASLQRTAPFNDRWVRQLHKEMFGRVWTWAGIIREKKLNIGVDAKQITPMLAALILDLHSWTGFNWPLDVQAAWLHHRAVNIHPFLNGNGRWSRMLANIWLKKNGQPVVQWPDCSGFTDKAFRHSYIKAIKAADDGDYKPLLTLQQQYMM